jgi:hypothetical protein
MATTDFDNGFWADPWIQEKSPLAKLLFIYFWTNPHRNITALYIISKKTIVSETSLTEEEVDKCLSELKPKILYDSDRSICWVPNYVKRQFLRTGIISDKIRVAIKKSLLLFIDHPFFLEFKSKYSAIFSKDEIGYPEGIDRVSIGYPEGIDRVSIGYPEGQKEGEKSDRVSIGYPYPMDTLQVKGKGYKVKGKEERGMEEGDLIEVPATRIQLKEGFNRFWDAFPKKTKKIEASEEWFKLKPSIQLMDQIISKVISFKESKEWKKDDGVFVPNPKSFIKNKRWLDEIKVEPQEKPKSKPEPVRVKLKDGSILEKGKDF